MKSVEATSQGSFRVSSEVRAVSPGFRLAIPGYGIGFHGWIPGPEIVSAWWPCGDPLIFASFDTHPCGGWDKFKLIRSGQNGREAVMVIVEGLKNHSHSPNPPEWTNTEAGGA